MLWRERSQHGSLDCLPHGVPVALLWVWYHGSHGTRAGWAERGPCPRGLEGQRRGQKCSQRVWGEQHTLVQASPATGPPRRGSTSAVTGRDVGSVGLGGLRIRGAWLWAPRPGRAAGWAGGAREEGACPPRPRPLPPGSCFSDWHEGARSSRTARLTRVASPPPSLTCWRWTGWSGRWSTCPSFWTLLPTCLTRST